MALAPSTSSRQRRLSELLEEKQEPFLLDIFLLERGYLKKAADVSRATTVPCLPGVSHGVLAQVEGALRSVLGALVVHGKRSRRKDRGRSRARKSDVDSTGCISSSYSSSNFEVGSATSSSNSICPEEAHGLAEARRRTTKGDPGRRILEWEDEGGAERDSKQLSPVSVFELLSEDSDSSPAREPFRQKEQTPTATTLGHTTLTEAQTSSLRTISQRLLGQTPTAFKVASDPRIGRLISWQHLRYEVSLAEEETTTQMVESDIAAASRKRMCGQLEDETREMGAEIAEHILEEILCSCVTDNLSHVHCIIPFTLGG